MKQIFFLLLLTISSAGTMCAEEILCEERLQHKQSMHEYYQSKIALDRAMQRLQTAAKYKR